MFEYDYVSKTFNGFRYFIIGDEYGDDWIVAYITPQGKIVRLKDRMYADPWRLEHAYLELGAA